CNACQLQCRPAYVNASRVPKRSAARSNMSPIVTFSNQSPIRHSFVSWCVDVALSPASACPAWSILGVDLQKRLVEFGGVVRHPLGHAVRCPGNGVRIRVHLIRCVAPKGLQSVAGGIKKVDRGAPGNAVPPGSEVNPDVMAGEDVGGAENRFRRVNHEGRVVKAPGSTWHNSQIMWRRTLPEPGRHRRAIGLHEYFTGAEL